MAYEIDDLRKGATDKTKRINKRIKENLNKEGLAIEKILAKKNTVKKVKYPLVRREDSFIPVWDLERYRFLLEDPMPDTINPKLYEQAKLNMNAGIFQVTDKIFQVRGYDLANMTFFWATTGWIIIGCLTSKETAKAAIELMESYFGKKHIAAVLITHSHVDHYGGIEGVLEKAGEDTKVYVPQYFLDDVIEENVNVGVAMTRRALYMYGELLLKDAKGQVDSGIGKYISTGKVTLSNRLEEIVPNGDTNVVEKVIDGKKIIFQLTPDTEAPAEMNIYIQSERALCIAENCTATLHNLYTLRGAEVRDPIAWAKYIQEAIDLFGNEMKAIFMVHNWARYEKDYIIDYMEKQRDLYQYINDQTVRRINQGYTLDDVGRMVKLPESLSEPWYNGSFYGTVNHNAKAVYQKYMGWYNSNPVDLNKLFPEESAKKFVAYMGGEEKVLKKAYKDYELGEYQWVAEVTKQVIYANPDNKEAKYLCADALEQLGYIAESGPWRNEYLVGAQELRYGKEPSLDSSIDDEVLDALPLDKIMYMFSVRVDGMTAGDFDYSINFIIPDRAEKASTQLKRGIFRYMSDTLDEKADVTVIMNKETLYELATTNNKPKSSDIIVKGDLCIWQKFLWTQDYIDPSFNIVTPVEKPKAIFECSEE